MSSFMNMTVNMTASFTNADQISLQNSVSPMKPSNGDDMLTLGLLSQSFFLIGFISVLVVNIGEGRDLNIHAEIPIGLSCLMYISTYVVGHYMNDNFSFVGWGYVFICALISAMFAFLICIKNDMNRGKTNMIALSLAFSLFIATTTVINHDRHNACFRIMSFALGVTMVPLFMSISILKNDIRSFDTAMKNYRYRLIGFVALIQSRIMVIWNFRSCGGHIIFDTAAFWGIIIDLMTLILASDFVWN